jgi:hypothetical protein
MGQRQNHLQAWRCDPDKHAGKQMPAFKDFNWIGWSQLTMQPVCPCRGLTAALLGEPAQNIRDRHPNLTQASKLLLRPFLGLPIISNRIREVDPHRN